jgi:RNA polymerase sigma-70 factor (ECF subfamily)
VHREVLLLTFVQELSYQETATTLEIPVGTVKSRLSNARRALRTLLEAKEDTKR